MSHGVHAVQHEVDHQLEHEREHGDGHGKSNTEGRNKKVALLISVLALFLAFSETLGKSAQTLAISYNVEASNLWAFFQAKTIRQTVLRTAADTRAIDVTAASEEPIKVAMQKQIEAWKRTAERYETEPETQEGRRELMARAKVAEARRDIAMERYHNYEIASAAFQIGIVLASATVITGMIVLSWLAGGLGLIGLGLLMIGLLSPTLPHDVMHYLHLV